MSVLDLKNAAFSIKGGGSSDKVTVKLFQGTLSFNETKNREYISDRGKLSGVKDGEEVPMDVNFSFIWEYLKAASGDPATVEDALKKRGVAAGWQSTDSDTCAPYCVDLELVVTEPCTEGNVTTYLFPEFRYEKLDHDAKNASVACSGKCNVTEPTITSVPVGT